MTDAALTKFEDAVRDHCRKQKDEYIAEIKALKSAVIAHEVVVDALVAARKERDEALAELDLLRAPTRAAEITVW